MRGRVNILVREAPLCMCAAADFLCAVFSSARFAPIVAQVSESAIQVFDYVQDEYHNTE